MPVVKLDPDTPLDPASSSGSAVKLPSDTKLDPAPKGGDGAFFGLAKTLPEGVSQYLPGFTKGPSVGEQLTATQQNLQAKEQKRGRPLTLSERLAAEPVTSSPFATGFATHQLGKIPTAAATAAAKGASEKFVTDEYTRAIKPTTSGKGTAGRIDRYQDRTRDAVSSIVENRANLKFSDADGKVRSGDLPKTLEEFGDAIEQTKQTIYNKYDALAKQSSATGFSVTNPVTGESGSVWATVPLSGVASELQKIATDATVQLMHPELAQYAQGRAAAFGQKGGLSASDAQRAVTMLNQSLKSFYSNPGSPEIAARAHVDAMIANHLRSALDKTIEATAGPGYQELKNQHGALKAIEEHVNKRAQFVARQEKGGGILGRLTDVASAEEVIRGFITLNPAAVARGTFMKLWSEGVKYLRSPNRAVTRLFEEADSPRTPSTPRSPVSPIFPDRREPWKEVVPDAR
jgi:hypothetical protein